jgi:hypothetical protein
MKSLLTSAGIKITSIHGTLVDLLGEPIAEASALSKAALGSRFLSIVETGRFHYWTDEEELPISDAWWFWRQVEACTYELQPDLPYDRGLRWSVPDTASVSTPAALAGSDNVPVGHAFAGWPGLRVTLHPATAPNGKPTIRIAADPPELAPVAPSNGSASNAEPVTHVIYDFDAD